MLVVVFIVPAVLEPKIDIELLGKYFPTKLEYELAYVSLVTDVPVKLNLAPLASQPVP